jgi:hypothetical protein
MPPEKILGILYIVVAALVMTLLIAIPLFPFCKLWSRIKNHHYDLWMSKGPFGLWDMMAHPELVRGFLDIVALADKDETLLQKDPELVKWARICREVWKMMPRSFLSQIGVTLLFVYFVWFFTGTIAGALGKLFVQAPLQ